MKLLAELFAVRGQQQQTSWVGALTIGSGAVSFRQSQLGMWQKTAVSCRW